ncbi:MAG: hypothetical protein IKR51_02075 [Oscillospiraceae bacterium]|nr:hypothetical protein [Oscillospiraceae bacterium]
MADRIVLLLVEGSTEVEFYKAVIKLAHDKMKSFPCLIKYENLQGIGNYKKDALRRFNNVKRSNPGKEIHVFLCVDTDVFEFQKKPPINRQSVKKELLDAGAKKVSYIEAVHSIEDWFLCDYLGVLSYLGLPSTTRKPKGTGQEALKKLFRQADKVYVKGALGEPFIKSLDVSKILQCICETLKPFCKSASFDCQIVCENCDRAPDNKKANQC